MARWLLAAVAAFILGAASIASACPVTGKVVCKGTEVGIAGVVVTMVHTDGTVYTATTDAGGAFTEGIYGGTWDVSLDLGVAGGGTVAEPPMTCATGVVLSLPTYEVEAPWCGTPTSPCWMTAGGAKFDPVSELRLASRGPRISFGGNVAPSCDLTPGNGGQWNHVDHGAKLHFQGFDITEVACDGVPTNSPAAPVNHITFRGTGRVQGIASNAVPASYANVCFVAEAIDWQEPATKTAPIDQYFIRVWDCNGTGANILMLGTSEAPITITEGNIQIHPCQ